MTKLELLEQTFDLFQGQAASIVGSLVAAELYDIDDFSDIDVFFDSTHALHYGVSHAMSQGFKPDAFTRRKLALAHRWGGRRFHVETYRLYGDDGRELNLSHKLLANNPVRTTAGVLLSFDFGFLLAGYDCLASDFDEAFLDLRRGYFPKEYATNGPYPMVPDKGRAWVEGMFGQNSGVRQVHRTAKYALRGYDMSAVIPQLSQGYVHAAQDNLEQDTPRGHALADIYLTINDHLLAEEWQTILDACDQLGFNEPIETLQAVFD